MRPKIKILAFAGSTRQNSFNKKLAKFSISLLKELGVNTTFLDLRDYPLPLYDGDTEATAYPENAAKIKQIFQEHDGFLISSPEYNSSISGVLKNTIDWISRSITCGTDLSAFTGKVAAIISTSPGHLGGLRALVALQTILSNIGVFVIPNKLAISQAMDAFDTQGNLIIPKNISQLKEILTQLTEATERFSIDLN